MRTPRARRAPSTSGRRPSWSTYSVPTTAPGQPTLLTVTERGTFEGGTSTLQLREQPDDRQRWESCRERLLAARAAAGAAGPRRQGGGRLERSGDQRPGGRGHPARDPVVRRRRGAVWRVPGRHPSRERPAAARLARGRRRIACRRARGLRLRRHRVPRARVRHGRRCLGGSRRRAARHGARALRGGGRRLPRHRRRRRGADGAAARPVGQREPERTLVGGARAALVRRTHRIGSAP